MYIFMATSTTTERIRMNDVQVNFFCPFLRIPIIDRAYNPTSYTNSHQEWNISRQMAEDDIMNNISNVNAISDLPLKKNKKNSIYASK